MGFERKGALWTTWNTLNCIGLDDNKYKFGSGKVRLKA
jgi:hypothetical protein